MTDRLLIMAGNTRHLSEKSGRGVPRIIEVYGREAFEFRQNSIVVTIPFNRIDLVNHTEGIPQVIPQVDGQAKIESIEEKIIEFCVEPRDMQELMNYLNYKDRKTVRKYLKPLIEKGCIAMTVPEKPNSSKQKYIAIK